MVIIGSLVFNFAASKFPPMDWIFVLEIVNQNKN